MDLKSVPLLCILLNRRELHPCGMWASQVDLPRRQPASWMVLWSSWKRSRRECGGISRGRRRWLEVARIALWSGLATSLPWGLWLSLFEIQNDVIVCRSECVEWYSRAETLSKRTVSKAACTLGTNSPIITPIIIVKRIIGVKSLSWRPSLLNIATPHDVLSLVADSREDKLPGATVEVWLPSVDSGIVRRVRVVQHFLSQSRFYFNFIFNFGILNLEIRFRTSEVGT
jgi:hypothetical protein